MTISLDKPEPFNGTPDMYPGLLMGNEEWCSTVLLPIYLSTIYPPQDAGAVNAGLKNNNLLAFRRLLIMERTYDNSTGQYAEER